jgi:hypothetical protein
MKKLKNYNSKIINRKLLKFYNFLNEDAPFIPAAIENPVQAPYTPFSEKPTQQDVSYGPPSPERLSLWAQTINEYGNPDAMSPQNFQTRVNLLINNWDTWYNSVGGPEFCANWLRFLIQRAPAGVSYAEFFNTWPRHIQSFLWSYMGMGQAAGSFDQVPINYPQPVWNPRKKK